MKYELDGEEFASKLKAGKDGVFYDANIEKLDLPSNIFLKFVFQENSL